MGNVLLWIENLATALLLVATLLACIGRVRSRRAQLLLALVVTLLPVLLYAALVMGLLVVNLEKRVRVDGLYAFVVLSLTFTCISFWLGFHGLRSRADAEPKAATWPRGKLALALAVAAVLHLTTFWNVDTAIRLSLARVRAEAAELALSVAPPRVADQDNAMVVYQQAFENLPMEETRVGLLADAVGALLDAESGFDFQSPELARRLEYYAPVLEILRSAAAMPRYYADRNYARPSVDILTPGLYHFQVAVQLLALNARHKSAAGDVRSAIGDVDAIVAMARHVESEPFLFSILVAGEMERIAWETLEIVLGAAQCSEEDLTALNIDPRLSHRRLLQRALRSEEACGLATFCKASDSDILEAVRVIHGVDGPGAERDSRGLGIVLGHLYRVFMLPGDLRMYRDFMLRLRSIVAEPGHKIERRCEDLENWWQSRRRGILSSLMATLTRLIPPAVQADCRRGVARLGIAMHAYRARHGFFPEKLEELAPEFIELMPTDTYSGMPLRLKRSETGWVVFSVGPAKNESHAVLYLAGLSIEDPELASLMFGHRSAP